MKSGKIQEEIPIRIDKYTISWLEGFAEYSKVDDQ